MLLSAPKVNGEPNKGGWTPSYKDVPKSQPGQTTQLQQATALSSPPLPGPYSSVLTPTSNDYTNPQGHTNPGGVTGIDSKPPLTAALF